MTPEASGILLAGGRATRFGADKLAATLDGRPLLSLAIDALSGVCSEVIVVAPPGVELADPIPTVGKPPGFRVVPDAVAFGGPLAAAATGLEAAAHPLVVVAGGDMPTMVPAVLELLLARLAASGASAAVLGSGARLQPLPLALRRKPAITAAKDALERGERSLRALFAAVPGVTVEELDWRALDPTGATLRDVDRPADLQRAAATDTSL